MTQQRQGARQLQAAAQGGQVDPFGQNNRQMYQQKLAQLYQDPNFALEQLPGYNFAMKQGLKNINREAAKTGQYISTNRLYNVADYTTGLAQQQYAAEADRLARLSGAQFAPQAGAYSDLVKSGYNVDQSATGSLMDIGGALMDSPLGKAGMKYAGEKLQGIMGNQQPMAPGSNFLPGGDAGMDSMYGDAPGPSALPGQPQVPGSGVNIDNVVGDDPWGINPQSGATLGSVAPQIGPPGAQMAAPLQSNAAALGQQTGIYQPTMANQVTQPELMGPPRSLMNTPGADAQWGMNPQSNPYDAVPGNTVTTGQGPSPYELNSAQVGGAALGGYIGSKYFGKVIGNENAGSAAMGGVLGSGAGAAGMTATGVGAAGAGAAAGAAMGPAVGVAVLKGTYDTYKAMRDKESAGRQFVQSQDWTNPTFNDPTTGRTGTVSADVQNLLAAGGDAGSSGFLVQDAGDGKAGLWDATAGLMTESDLQARAKAMWMGGGTGGEGMQSSGRTSEQYDALLAAKGPQMEGSGLWGLMPDEGTGQWNSTGGLSTDPVAQVQGPGNWGAEGAN